MYEKWGDYFVYTKNISLKTHQLKSDLFDAEAGHRHDHGGIIADLIWSNPAGEDGFLFGWKSEFPTFVPVKHIYFR